MIQKSVIENASELKQFILLIDVVGMHLEYANPGLISFAGIQLEAGSDIFDQIIHPDDLNPFLAQLRCLKDSEEKRTAQLNLRIKSSEGSYKEFSIKNRRYRHNLNNKSNLVICLAEPVNSQHDIENEDPSLKEAHDLPANPYFDFLQQMNEAYCSIEIIFDNSGKPVDFLFLESNQSFEQQTNFKDVEGMTMKELSPNLEDHWFQIYGKVAITGKPAKFQHFTETNGEKWFDVSALKTGSTSSRRLMVFFREITHIKHAEEEILRTREMLRNEIEQGERELRESNQLLQSVFDTTDLGIAVLQRLVNKQGKVTDFRFLRINKILRRMYGEVDPVGKRYREVTRYGEELKIFEALTAVAETGKSIDTDIFYNKADFNNWFRLKAKREKDLIIVTVEDITQKKIEAKQLEDSLNFRKQLVSASAETILIANLNTFSVRYINRDIFPEGGITRERVEGMPLQEILPYIHPRDREKIIYLHKQLLKSREDEIAEIELRLKLNGVVWEWFNVRGKVFHRKNDHWVDEYVLLVKNINKQKDTQHELLKAKKLSIEGEIARTFAHELRNPLASIMVATDVLEKQFNLGGYYPGPQKYLDILNRSTHTLNKLISHLLNSSNYSPAVLDKVNLSEIVEEAISRASDRIYLAGIQLNKNYNDTYPVLADKEKLIIALLNIIVNASEATKPDEGIIDIEIKEVNTEFILSIKDNGHGMDKAQQEKLFDAFYTSKEEGVGIGLNSVKNILEEHDAKIDVISEPGVGTCFNISFTRAEKS
ncbi:ATP-binding protein [Gramella sp. GC03-9]|uniref:histidine kinase n=1 Tax=Christiangramia oceanisediminis TaxID=2920386 RepID=A0A9X2KZ82_9FLAO|nr:ATP-binding protein [Gramella oceanisediminis]MCP9200866.1 ATP-binding protein [Gramella oceanisediminis]